MAGRTTNRKTQKEPQDGEAQKNVPAQQNGQPETPIPQGEGQSTQGRPQNHVQTAPQNHEQSLPMVFDVRIHSIKPNDSIKGTASININNAFAVRGLKIVEGSNGLFVSMPSYKAGNEYRDICFPITVECRRQLNDAVISAYEQAFTQGQNSVAKLHEMQQAPEGQAMEMTGM